MSKDNFEDLVFNKLESRFRKIGRTAYSDASFSQEILTTLLNFQSLKAKDPKAQISQNLEGYKINLSKPHLAFDLCNLLQNDNNEIKLVFDNELLEFDPEDELIHKSKIPLWIICPMDGGRKVVIKRAW